jgi:hypothetical protein
LDKLISQQQHKKNIGFALSEKIDDIKKNFEVYVKLPLLTKRSIMSRATLRDDIKAFAGSLLHLTIEDDEFRAGKKFLTYGLEYIGLLAFGLLAALFITMWLLTPVLHLSSLHITGNYNYDYSILFAIGGITFAILTYWVSTHSLFQRIIQSTCFYYSVSAAKSLEHCEFVEASFYVDKLISFINQYSKTKKAKIESFKVKVKELFHDNIENLCDHKPAVVKAIRESGVLRVIFADHLYMLANSLFSDEDFDINQANDSLGLLVENCQKYFQEDTFLQKHKTTYSSLKGLAGASPFLVPIITGIIPVILKLVFHYPP